MHEQEALAAAPGANEPSRGGTWRPRLTESPICWPVRASHRKRRPNFGRSRHFFRSWSTRNPELPDLRTALAGKPQLPRLDAPSNGAGHQEAELAAPHGGAGDPLRSWPTTNPAVTQFRNDLAVSHYLLGNLLAVTGKSLEAEAEYCKRWRIQQKLTDDNPAVTESPQPSGRAYNNLGNLLPGTDKLAGGGGRVPQGTGENSWLATTPAVTQFRGYLSASHANLGRLLMSNPGKSLEVGRVSEALAIQQKLADDNPAVTQFREFLAESHSNLGILLSNTGKSTEAEAEYRKALAIQQKLANDNPKVPEFRKYGGQPPTPESPTRSARSAGRPRPATATNGRSPSESLIEEAPKTTSYCADLLFSGLSRDQTGDPAGAAADARRALALYDGLPSRSGEEWFETACCHAALAGLAGRDGSGVSAAAAASEADTAMALLAKAVTMGYRNPNAFRTESALDPLRNRPDFQILMMDLVMPTKPFAR